MIHEGSAASGPKRYPLLARFDLVPPIGVWLAALAMGYGFVSRGGVADWREYPIEGDKSPLNHALGHIYEALAERPRTMRRRWKLAKAAANLLMACELEVGDRRETFANWFAQEKWPDTSRKGEEAKRVATVGG